MKLGEKTSMATASTIPAVPSQHRQRKVSPTRATPKIAGTALAVHSVDPKRRKLAATAKNWKGPCRRGLYL